MDGALHLSLLPRRPDRRAPVTYRGPDRRSALSASLGVTPTELATDAAALLAVSGAVAVAVAVIAYRLPDTVTVLHLVAGGVSSGLCLVAAVQAYVRWRLVGDGVTARVAVALVVYGTTVAPLTATGEDGAAGAIGQTIGMAVAVVTLVAATRGPDVEVSFRFLRRSSALLALPPVAVLVATAAPGAAARLVDARVAGLRIIEAGGAVIVVVAAALLTVGALRRNRRLLARCALAQVMLVVVPALASAEGGRPGAQLVALAIQVSAIGMVVGSTTTEVKMAFGAVDRRHDGLVRRWRDASTMADRLSAAESERTHEIRSALLAIEGASEVLSRHVEDLGAPQDAELASALHRETARLQQLLSARPGVPEAAYRLLDVIRPLVVARRAAGQVITLEVPATLEVSGRPHALAEAVTNILANAAAHAPGAHVHVSAEPGADLGTVVLTILDDGPGFEPEALQHGLERGWRGRSAAAGGQGIGLHLAARLLAQEGGGLRLGRPDSHRGALVVLELPAARSARDVRAAVNGP